MKDPSPPSINSWFEDELRLDYNHERRSVDPSWKPLLETNGHTVATPAAPPPSTTRTSTAVAVADGDHLVPLRGPALRIAENMTASLAIPVATSQRVMPVKVMDENRRAINQHRSLSGLSKVSYTHLVAWAIVRALEKVPALNQAYSENGEGSFRITHDRVNLGLAVDVEGKEGSRSLKVPSVKNAQAMNFAEFLQHAAPAEIIERINSSAAEFIAGLHVVLPERPGIVVEELPVGVHAVARIGIRREPSAESCPNRIVGNPIVVRRCDSVIQMQCTLPDCRKLSRPAGRTRCDSDSSRIAPRSPGSMLPRSRC